MEKTHNSSRSSAYSHSIIDCDVHVGPKSFEEIRQYLDPPWFDRARPQRGIYEHPFGGMRFDARPPEGGRPGSDPAFLRQQLIDAYHVQHAVLVPRANCWHLPNPDHAAALAAAFNEWLAETWLGKYNPDGVFRGSITVAPQDPQRAAREIEKWAGHPYFIQVLLDSGARMAYGNRFYWPIYEACARNHIPVAIHVGTDAMGVNPPHTIGYPTHYIEWQTCLSLGYQSHLVSFMTEGVFEQYPDFRLVLVEGGVAWLAPMLWRLDNNYKALRQEVPWMKRRPHEYVRDHVRLTSQPIESPDNPQYLLQIFEMIDAEHILFFASDYPHWDFDSPTHSFPKLSDSLHRRIFLENAKEFYGL